MNVEPFLRQLPELDGDRLRVLVRHTAKQRRLRKSLTAAVARRLVELIRRDARLRNAVTH